MDGSALVRAVAIVHSSFCILHFLSLAPQSRPNVLVGTHGQAASETSRRHRQSADGVSLGQPRRMSRGHRSQEVQRLSFRFGKEAFQQIVAQELPGYLRGKLAIVTDLQRVKDA